MSTYYISGDGYICKTTGHGQCDVLGTVAGCEIRAELDRMIELANRGYLDELSNDASWVFWVRGHGADDWQFLERAKGMPASWAHDIICAASRKGPIP